MTSPLEELAATVGGQLLVAHEPAVPGLGDTLPGRGHHVVPLGGEIPSGPWAGVVLAVRDRAALRQAAASLPDLGTVTVVACMLTEERRVLALRCPPVWPPVVDFSTRLLPTGGSWTVVQLAAAFGADAVLRELARLAVPSRAPVVPAAASAGTAPDEAVINPIGFEPRPPHGTVALRGDRLEGLRCGHEDVVVPLPRGEVGPEVVRVLRSHRAVRVTGDATTSTGRTVTALAMAGIPLVLEPVATARLELGDALRAAVTRPVDLDDPLRREEHSIGLRRAALLSHSAAAARFRTAHPSQPDARRFPSCSVVLCTRRPGQLDFALRQVARQHPVEPEVVVVGHGFAPDPARVRAVVGDRAAEVLSVPETTLFGDALRAGVAATSGDLVVKMDDDDWYGRDFLLDLLLAREYSGADVVGTTAEMVYLHQLDRTIRTREPNERFARLVAGGTLMLSREVLAALGGFRPVRRFVDRQVLEAAAVAGVRVYRAHGLGYLLRRTAAGHTWDPGLDFFLDGERVVRQWDGFVPSRLLDVEPEDRPPAPDGGRR